MRAPAARSASSSRCRRNDLSDEKVRLCYYDMALALRPQLHRSPACSSAGTTDKMTEVVNAVTGWNTTFLELHKVGERAATLARVFNLREGFTAADDTLPKRIFTKFASGPLAGRRRGRGEVAPGHRQLLPDDGLGRRRRADARPSWPSWTSPGRATRCWRRASPDNGIAIASGL